MALTFPRDMPARPPEAVGFELDRADFLSRDRSGRLNSAQMGFALWRLDMDLTRSSAADFDEIRAWVASLEGAKRTFYGCDPSRPFPKAHANGFSGLMLADGVTPFDGDCASWSVDVTRGLLGLTGLSPGLQLSTGDYVGFRWTTADEPRRALVRALAPATADGAGEIEDLPVSPAVPGGDVVLTPDTAIAYLDNPVCIMRLDPRHTSIGKLDPLNRADVRVVALQDLRP